VDAIQLIQKDHRQIEELFRRFERAERDEDRKAQGAIARDVVRALSVHAALEEQYVYPVIRRSEDAGILDALEEHHAAKVLLSEIEALTPASERFAAKMHVLAENVRQHVEEEERELLPILERTLDADRLRTLGETLERARATSPTRPHPAAPDTPPGVFVAGAAATVYDRVRDALRGGTELLRGLGSRGISLGVDGMRGLGARAQERGRTVVERAAEGGRRAIDETQERARRAGAELGERVRATADVVGRESEAVSGRITTATQQAARAARTGRRGKRGRKGEAVSGRMMTATQQQAARAARTGRSGKRGRKGGARRHG
jgi:hemerythrin-like domain-containing protein